MIAWVVIGSGAMLLNLLGKIDDNGIDGHGCTQMHTDKNPQEKSQKMPIMGAWIANR
jgi:hypothetical protein